MGRLIKPRVEPIWLALADHRGKLLRQLDGRFQGRVDVADQAQRLLVHSFHGVPKRTLALGDPYHCECHKTARLVRERLGVPADFVTVTFQSRLGKAEWLQPYTEPSLIEMAKQGIHRVDVMCPGFTSDNLETLEEINMEAREAFLHAGGREFHHIPCLNDQHEWIAALSAIAISHLHGWPTQAGDDPVALETQRARAKALGANV